MARTPGSGPEREHLDQVVGRILAALDDIEGGLDRARAAAEAEAAAATRRNRALGRMDAALEELDELLGGPNGKA